MESARDRGFTLVEIIVALGILMTVAAALLPQLIIGIRSTETARLVSQAKGVAQGEIEHMRNLPWHVAPDTSTATHEYYDVFDNYYPDVEPPEADPECAPGGPYATPEESWSGFVAEGDAGRCDYESDGPMYRTVVRRTSPGFMVVINVQFLAISGAAHALSPDSSYDTNGTDNLPRSSRIGVTVTLLYDDEETDRPISTYTELADEQVARTRLEVVADGTAVEVVTSSPADLVTGLPVAGTVSLTAGALHLRGAVANTSTVAATATSIAAGRATETSTVGANVSRRSPVSPDAPDFVATPRGSGGLDDTCLWACWSDSSVEPSSVSAVDGLPNAGLSSLPVRAWLSGGDPFTFSASGDAGYRDALGLVGPVVEGAPSSVATADGGCTTISGSVVGVAGYLSTAQPSSVTSADACVVAQAGTTSFFPTDFAPFGVVQVRLPSVFARCQVGAAVTGPGATYGYGAEVLVHNPDKEPESGRSPDAYDVVATITSPAPAIDPLAGVDLAREVGGQHVLGDYVSSWSSPTTADVLVDGSGGSRVDVPGVVTLHSTPLRTGTRDWVTSDPVTGEALTVPEVDLSSTVSTTLGTVSCSAKDDR